MQVRETPLFFSGEEHTALTDLSLHSVIDAVEILPLGCRSCFDRRDVVKVAVYVCGIWHRNEKDSI